MANVIKHKRGSGSDPGASDLVVGEVAIRTDTGKLFTKMDNGSVAEIAGGGSDIAINTLSSSSGTGGGSATFNGSAYRFTLSQPPSVSAYQLLVSINGVIQKPVSGTGQPSEGFAVDGTDIILGDAPETGADFFILTFKSLGVSEPADNSVTSAKILDGTILNVDINASAAIAGTKISPDFGSQNIVTTGDLTVDTTTLKVDASNNRVGIGTASPVKKLHIADAGDVGIALQTTNANTNKEMWEITCGGNASNEADLVFQSRTDAGSGGIEAMRLSSSGRVGIGTSSPAYTLDVVGDGGGSFSASTNSTQGQISIVGKNSGGSVSAISRIKSHPDGSSNQSHMAFETRNSSATMVEAMRITSDQKVGIGTTSPDRTIHCHNSSNTTNVRAKFSNGTTGEGASDGFEVGINASDPAQAVLVNYENSPMAFFTNATERMRIHSNGRISAGTTSADATLHIKSPDGGNNRLILEHENDSANEQNQISFLNDGTQTAFIKSGKDSSNNNFGIILGTGTTEKLRLTDGGAPNLRLGSINNANIYTSSGTGNEGAWLVAGGGSQFAASNSVCMLINRKTTNGKITRFFYNGSEVGSISTNANSLPSDRNFKTNISDLNLGLSLVNKLKPSQFNYKIDEPNTPVMYGLIAQELEESLTSEGVTKNSTQLLQHHPTEDTESDYDVDYGKFVPILINSIKELAAKVETLETKVAALEAK